VPSHKNGKTDPGHPAVRFFGPGADSPQKSSLNQKRKKAHPPQRKKGSPPNTKKKKNNKPRHNRAPETTKPKEKKKKKGRKEIKSLGPPCGYHQLAAKRGL